MASIRVPGVLLAATAAGIRYSGRDDLVVMQLAEGTATAAVFTRNAFCAAPVSVAKAHMAQGAVRCLLINAGNANAGTGARGLADARASCEAAAAVLGCRPEQVLPFSTGVIGEYLPVDRIEAALPALQAGLSADGWDAASRAIMTTDTVPKLAERSFDLQGRTVRIAGIAKGAGMICPNMATMLAFLATDAAVAPALLQASLVRAVDRSFNRITIDGDTSTNDACVLCATGVAGNAPVDGSVKAEATALFEAVAAVCDDLATAIVVDGEGATKVVTIEVVEARTAAEARAVADTIAHSPLVKTALFAGDPNWGRILAAVGRAPLDALNIESVRIWLDACLIVASGGRADSYTEALGREVMAKNAFTIRVALGRGEAAASVLTCDLSYDYVRINAEYRS